MARLAIIAMVSVPLLMAGAPQHGDAPLDDRTYVRRNVAVINGLPLPRVARRPEIVSQAYRAPDDSPGPPSGYWTVKTLAVPALASPAELILFYRSRLRDGWRLEGTPSSASLALRRDRAYVQIVATPGMLFIGADHACYQSASSTAGCS